MRHDIWAVLREYAGRWVAVDAGGKVLGAADALESARAIAGARTVLYASA
jgi:hypothetical protein